MRKVLICSLIFLVLALATTVPCALCARPPVSPWPPEEKWDPMPYWEDMPSYTAIPIWYPGEYELDAEAPFWLSYGWVCFPTNVMYYAAGEHAGEPTTIPNCLQDHTDMANCIYTVTMNEVLLKPTGKFTANCQWFYFPYDDTWYVIPKAILHDYYIEFPQGLAAGTYTIELYGKPCWGEPFSWTVTLTVTD